MRRLVKSVMLIALAVVIITIVKRNAMEVKAEQLSAVEACVVEQPKAEIATTIATAEASVAQESSYEIPEELKDMDPAQINAVALIYIPELGWTQAVYQAEDNEYYLHHDAAGQKSNVGELHVNCLNNADFSDNHTFIFGHNMNTQIYKGAAAKFGELKYLLNGCENTEIWILTADREVLHYEIFSIRKTTVGNDKVYDLLEDGHVSDYVAEAQAQSEVDLQTVVEGEKILTLSTCFGVPGSGSRLVVQAVQQ